MTYFWLTLAFTAGIFDNLYNYFSRKALLHNQDALTGTWWFSTLRSVLFIPFLAFDYSFIYSLQNLVLLVFLGLVNFVNVYLFMQMHSTNHLSVSTIIVRLRLIWVPLIAYFVFMELLSVKEYFGIALIFAATILLVSPKKLVKDKAVFVAVIFSLTTSIVTVLIKIVTEFASTPLIVTAMSLPTTCLIPLILNKPKVRLFANWRGNFAIRGLIAIFSVLLLYFLILALKIGGPVGKVNAIFQSVAVLSVFWGILLLKEKENIYKKIAASFIALIGVVLLS